MLSRGAKNIGYLPATDLRGGEDANSGRTLRETDGRYALKRIHASGGFGRVWLAYDSELGRNVAVKELRPERSSDEFDVERFLLRECGVF